MPGAILVIEDEEPIGELIREYLQRDGHQVVWVRSGRAGLEELRRAPVRLVVLDLGLPDIDGLEVCRAIGGELPVIVLSARRGEHDRILGLELGADDYVAKPFSPRELTARVRAVLRRTSPAAGPEHPQLLEFSDIRVDLRTARASAGGAPLDLTPLEFELLAYLLARPGRVVSRGELLTDVWGAEFASGTRTVDVHIAQLRRKLGRRDVIRTVRGTGYRVAAA